MDISLSDFGGAPVVLVFANDWTLGRESISDVNAIRGALRRLGAGMVVLSGTGVWSHSPAGEERFEAHDDEIEAEIARLASIYRVDSSRDGSRLPCVLVLDEHERVVFSHPSARPLRPALACAMALALEGDGSGTANDVDGRVLSRLVRGIAVAFLRERRGGLGVTSHPACERIELTDLPDADAAE